MKTTFTKTQIETLSAWEDRFRTAVQADWCRNPGPDALHVIWEIYTSATGDQRRYNDNCSHCILSLMRDCGRIYFSDREEYARQDVGLSDQPAEPVAKKAVKTRSKRAK